MAGVAKDTLRPNSSSNPLEWTDHLHFSAVATPGTLPATEGSFGLFKNAEFARGKKKAS
jgi:hypothetical protein